MRIPPIPVRFFIGGAMLAALGLMTLPHVAFAASGAEPNANSTTRAKVTSPAERRIPTGLKKKGWTLTFSDEFSGNALDTQKWTDMYPDSRTHGNGEQQYYAPDGYRVSGGQLHLLAERRAMGGKPYTSGMVSSHDKFSQRYGLFEIRAKFPKGKGMWPAFWLLPATKQWPPEMDVLEILGHEMNKIYFTNHWRNETGGHEGFGGNWVGPDFSAAFHTISMEWTPTETIWYVDGVERFHTDKGVPHEPMYLIANLAVGGEWPGNPDATTPFPSSMDIDYIRAYQRPAALKR